MRALMGSDVSETAGIATGDSIGKYMKELTAWISAVALDRSVLDAAADLDAWSMIRLCIVLRTRDAQGAGCVRKGHSRMRWV